MVEQEQDIVIDMRNVPQTIGPQTKVEHVFTQPPKEVISEYRIEWILPKDIPAVWEWVRKGILEVKRATGHRSRFWPIQVRKRLMENQCALFFVIKQDTPVGFYISYFDNDSFYGAPLTLVIWLAYNEDESGGAVAVAMEHFVKMGKQIGAEEVSWVSPRKGWARRAAQFGFEIGEVVYFKSLYDEKY